MSIKGTAIDCFCPVGPMGMARLCSLSGMDLGMIFFLFFSFFLRKSSIKVFSFKFKKLQKTTKKPFGIMRYWAAHNFCIICHLGILVYVPIMRLNFVQVAAWFINLHQIYIKCIAMATAGKI